MAETNSNNKVELRTSTLMGVCMVAGVGLSHISVSDWWSVILNTASLLFERVMDLVFALFGKTKPVANEIAMESFAAILQFMS